MTTPASPRPRPVHQLLGGAALGVATVVVWYAWLGRDTEMNIDPATGVGSGPYASWQVAGCLLSLIAVLVGAVLTGLRPAVAALTTTLAFTAAWTVVAAAEDESGLYAVGAALVLIGMTAGTLAVAYGTDRARRALSRRTSGSRAAYRAGRR